MTSYRKIAKDLVANTAIFLAFANVLWFSFFAFFTDLEPRFWLLIIPYGLLYLTRLKAKNVFLFSLAHILVVLGSVYLIGDSDSWLAILVFMVVISAFSFYRRLHGEPTVSRFFVISMLLIHTVMFVTQERAMANAEGIQVLLLLNLIVMLGFAAMHIHMENIDYRISFLRSLSNYNHNADKVLKFNNKMMAMFSGIFIAIGVAGTIFPIGGMIVRGVRWLLSPVFWFLQRFNKNFAHEHFSPAPSVEALPETIGDYDVDIHLEMVLDIFDPEHGFYEEVYLELRDRIVSVDQVFMILAALALIISLFITFTKFFNRKQRKSKLSNPIDDTEITLTSNIMGDLRALLPRLKIRHSNATRRAYAKKVNKHIKNGVQIRSADTTVTIADKIRPAENIDELTALYEKVRYGPER